MQNENLLEPDSPIVEKPTERSDKKNKTLWISLHAVFFLVGLAALIVLVVVYRDTISGSLVKVGSGFFVIVGLNWTRHLLRAGSMYRAIDPEHRTFKYRWAVAARFGGEAVTFFSFTGPFLGDATKTMLMKKDLPLTHGASAVIIDNILYYTSVIIIVLTGIVLLLINYGSSGSTMTNILMVIVIAMLLAFTGLSLAILYKVTPLTHAIDFLEKRNIAPKFLIRKRQDILNVENNVFQFYHRRPVDFFTVFAMSLTVHSISITEVFFAMRFLGYEATFAQAFIIEALTKVVNLSFGFVPGNMGVYEGGNGLILKTLGYGSTGVGIALALVRRGASLCSTAIGLCILIWRGAVGGARRMAKNRE